MVYPKKLLKLFKKELYVNPFFFLDSKCFSYLLLFKVTQTELEDLLKGAGFSVVKKVLTPKEVNQLIERIFGLSISKLSSKTNEPFVKVKYKFFFGKISFQQFFLLLKSFFSMFDQNEDGNVDAIEFALLLSVIVRGSEEEKLNCNSNLFKLKILNYFFF